MSCVLPPHVCERLEPRVLLAFGLTTTSSLYTVDTGAQVVFSVQRTATQGSRGDLSSIKYNGVEVQAPFASTSRYSHYESGLSSSTVVTAQVDPQNNWIKITCDDTGATGVGVIQYYIARNGFNNIYMATYAPGPNSPSPGEMRFITYFSKTVFPNPPAPSNISGAQSAIESSDVFQETGAPNYTHSKYYGEVKIIDDAYHGLVGSGVGAFMNMGSRESSSGGPFYRDIIYQTTGGATEVYNYTFSGHSQTENFRPGLHGPYALQFTNGSAPPAIDYSFLEGAGLTGWVAAAARGAIAGHATGIAAGHDAVVGLSNATAQYWTRPDASGNYSITGIKPGTYTETLYQDELAVSTRSVVITAGQTNATDITNTYYLPPAIFRIGTWDGTPIGFLNADKIVNMHPSDPRLSPWVDTNFTVGASTDGDWPMAHWKEPTLDDTNRITFGLTSQQAATPLTLRIGITRAATGGRPIISVNGGGYSSVPAQSTQPSTRGITLGNWRGNNWLYTYNISTSALHAGTNTIDIQVASGSTGSSPYLQAEVTYDAIDLVTTQSLTDAPHPSSVTVTPQSASMEVLAQQGFVAMALDQFSNPIPANFTWTANRGTADDTGRYTAPTITGQDAVFATVTGSSAVYSAATVNVTLSTVPGTSGNDVIRFVRNGNQIDVYVNSATPTYSLSDFATQGVLSVQGLDGNDVLTFDFSGGQAVPTAGVTFDGGIGSSQLQVLGAAPAGGGPVTLVGGNIALIPTTTMTDTAALSLMVSAGATLSMTSSQKFASLNIAGGSATLAQDGDRHLSLDALSITAGGSLDLFDNDMILRYIGGSPLPAMQTLIAAARNGGPWNGPGLTSSSARTNPQHNTTLGAMEATDYATLHGGTFAGETPGTSAVLVKYTYYGDANFSGSIDFDDYVRIDLGFNTSLTGWTNGDFNFSGAVDFDDYVLIDVAFNTQAASLRRAGIAKR